MCAARIQIVVAHLAGNEVLLLAAHRLPKLQQNRYVGQQILSALVRTRLRFAEVLECVTVDAFAQNVAGQRFWNCVALQQRQAALQQLEAAANGGDAPILLAVDVHRQASMQQQREHFHFVAIAVLGRVYHFGDQLQPN